MKSILMATDLSARSDRALERAADLVRDRGGELTILHVVDEDLPPSLADAQQRAAGEVIQKHVETFTNDNQPSISIKVVLGRDYVGILEMSEKVDAELIVLGIHREDAFKDMFRGSTAERVICAGDIPVLLVKDRVSDPYQRIIVAADFSVYSRRAIEFAVDFAPRGEIHVVHAYDVPFKGFLYGDDARTTVRKQHEQRLQQMVEEEMATFLFPFDAETFKLERIMQQGTVRGVIDAQVNRLKPDLLVIGTHGRTGVARALLGSVAQDLLRDPPCDVLAVKAW